MQKLRILLDVDDTLLDWSSRYDELLNKYGFPEINRTHEQHTFNLFAGRTPQEEKTIRDIMNFPNFYKNLEPKKGAQEAVDKMMTDGHEVFLVSSPWVSNISSMSDKYANIESIFGKHFQERLILTTDKTLVHGDVLVDDKNQVNGVHAPAWRHIYFTRPWNVNEEGDRINCWTEPWEEVVYA